MLDCKGLLCERESQIARLDLLINQPLRHFWWANGGQGFRIVEAELKGLVEWLSFNMYDYLVPPILTTAFASVVSLSLYLILRKRGRVYSQKTKR